VTGQVAPLYQELIATSAVKPSTRESQKLNTFIQKLQQKEVKSERKFLKSIFNATHQKFLKTYSQYADLGEVFQSGRFDCLTATALFSMILSETRFHYRIIETNYHIFILVVADNSEVLLETTDPLYGFVEDPAEIHKRINSYRLNNIGKSDTDKTHYQYSFNLFNEVSPNHLAGLLYFNQAIKAYNRQDLLACATLLDESKRIYESPRAEELAIVLIKTVLESNLSAEAKSRVIQLYRNSVMSKGSTVASR
jgi:hypothetical protein